MQKAAQLRLPASIKVESEPDIVVFLQESTFNARCYNFDVRALPHFSMFYQKQGGLMRVQTFGGKTWLTEFALLTGLSRDDFGSNKNSVFYSVVPHLRYSLFKELDRTGYETIVLSPMGFNNYNSGSSYRFLGMKQFYRPQDLGYAAAKNSNLWHITQADMLTYVKKILDKPTNNPRFIFVLSMAEHDPYKEDTADNV